MGRYKDISSENEYECSECCAIHTGRYAEEGARDCCAPDEPNCDYACVECGEHYDDAMTATRCCGPYAREVNYECECGTKYEDEYGAGSCCSGPDKLVESFNSEEEEAEEVVDPDANAFRLISYEAACPCNNCRSVLNAAYAEYEQRELKELHTITAKTATTKTEDWELELA